MSTQEYNTITASLKATVADIRKLNAKKITLNGEELNSKPVSFTQWNNLLYPDSFIPDENGVIYDLWKNAKIVHNGTTTFADLNCPFNLTTAGVNENGEVVEITKTWLNKNTYDKLSTIKYIKGIKAFDENNNFVCWFDAPNIIWATQGEPYVYPPNDAGRPGLFTSRECGDIEVESIISSFDNLICGINMFSYNNYGSNSLKHFKSSLPRLRYGRGMFMGACLESWSNDIPSLIDGEAMFAECNAGYSNLIKIFDSNIRNIKNGGGMFGHYLGFGTLEKFCSDTPNMIDGRNMFDSNNNMTTFCGTLQSLISGQRMFNYCKLSPSSVMYIINTIRDLTEERIISPSGSEGWQQDGSYIISLDDIYTRTISSSYVGKLTLGIGVSSTPVNGKDTAAQLLEFANEVGFDTWADLKQDFTNKGWTVTFQYGGTQTGITLSEDEQFRGIPVYARLIEVTPEGEEYTEEEKHHAEYCTEDGTKYYNIDWGHDVTNTTDYQYFGSLLEACGYFGVIPKKYLEA